MGALKYFIVGLNLYLRQINSPFYLVITLSTSDSAGGIAVVTQEIKVTKLSRTDLKYGKLHTIAFSMTRETLRDENVAKLAAEEHYAVAVNQILKFALEC